MTSRALTTVAAAVFVMTLLQFFSIFGGPWIALAVALALPFAALGVLKFFEVEVSSGWLIGGTVGASVIGVALAVLARHNDTLLGLCPLAACAVMIALIWWRNRSTARCNLCAKRLAGEVSFNCPRCGLLVCEERCWDFNKLRCRLCVQNRVPVLAPDGRWWDRTFGPATPHGRCNLCQAGSPEAELRNCPKCGRPQCRDCWDDANGECTRCGWRLAELPAALKTFIA